MKSLLSVFFFFSVHLKLLAQEQTTIVAGVERIAEIMADKEGVEVEDDSFLQQLINFKKHPLNLNEANEADLSQLQLLNDLQIKNFLNYRRLLGKLLDPYELQAIPSWNIVTIQRILPFITINQNKSLADDFKQRWAGGDHQLLIRSSRVLEKSQGFLNQTDSGNRYLGNANRMMIRYSYHYKNLLQWGLLGDKDAGEQFFRGKQKAGFDFYSFHLFASRMGIVNSLAIGDFTVNMGQGLLQWQSFALRKSDEVSFVKKQSAVLRPYTSAGEYNFHRGAGITLQKNKWQTTLFVSIRKTSVNLVKDSINDNGHISSLLISGYNRTASELEDKNNVQQLASGASVKFADEKWHVAFNAVQFHFSHAFQEADKPYNLFSPSGNNFHNESIDYSYTYKNCHLFGELAVDKKFNKAFLNGLLVSLAPAVDLSVVYRSISRRYQSFYADAFTENGMPVNESGMYAGVCIRPSDYLQINAYTDGYRFPWLKYRVDAPSSGREYFVQLLYKPNKKVELYSYYSNECKQQNSSGTTLTFNGLQDIRRKNWRINSTMILSPIITLRNRVETIAYNKRMQDEEEGFLMFSDIFYKPSLKHWSVRMRLLYFETAGYNSRLYAFENDLLYNFSVPVIFDKGFRYYINAHLDIPATKNKLFRKIKTECWLKASQSIYSAKKSVGSGDDAIQGNKKTEIKLQIMFSYDQLK